MVEIFNWLFGQYADYSTLFISLELIAVSCGVASVLLASRLNVLVFPIGLISTAIFVYLLWQWQLFGDMFINAYYTVMSLYGWFNWTKNKAQLQNRAKAMAILRARLLQAERDRQASERGELRRGQIGSGDRSEKIRTYNFPQDRLTDHRIGLTLHNLEGILDGDMDRLVAALQARAMEDRLAAIT